MKRSDSDKLNELRNRIHSNAVNHGFWQNKPSSEHFLCLVITELAEAVEADRTDKKALLNKKTVANIDGGIYDAPESRHLFEADIKDTLEDELADALIRLFDLAGAHDIDIETDRRSTPAVNSKQTFTENIYMIIRSMVKMGWCLELQINYAVFNIVRLADIMGFDIWWFVEHKMAYNEGREKLHGKSY